MGKEALGPEEDGISMALLWKGLKSLQPEPIKRIKEAMLALRATLLHDDSYFSIITDLWSQYRQQNPR